MKILAKIHSNQRRLIEILRIIDDADKPIGARAISDALCIRGYDLGERAVRYNLKVLDELGFTEKQGYNGRALTYLGIKELNDALVNDRIGFVNTRIEEYIYRTTFDPRTAKGNVVANVSTVRKADYEKARDIMTDAFEAGCTVSKRVLVLDEEEGKERYEIPEGSLGIITVCSITLDGTLLNKGIPVNTSYAGVVDTKEKVPLGFTDLIAYSGSSIDPMKIFCSRKVTRISKALRGLPGRILANVREIPVSAESAARELIEQCSRAGIDGLIKISEPGGAILECPVSQGKIGIALCAGVNAAVAASELGVDIRTSPISTIVDYSRMGEMR